MGRLGIILSVLLMSGTSTVTALEQGSPLKSLDTADQNKGWESVGRLNFADEAYCTGSLIAEDLVLTAAHCLFNNQTGEKFEVGDIEFLAGWRNGRAAAYRGVDRIEVHPDFTFSVTDKVSRVAHDLALLRLDQPIKIASLKPFDVDARPEKGATVGVVSYAKNRSEAASLQESCKVMARQGGVLVLSCEVDHGASGSPIFLMKEGEAPKIVSIVSAMAKVRDKDVALGTALTRPLITLKEIMAMDADTEQEPALLVTRDLPSVRTFGEREQASAGGAKFLKLNNN